MNQHDAVYDVKGPIATTKQTSSVGLTRNGNSPIYGIRDSYLLDFEIFLGIAPRHQSGEIKAMDSQMPFSPMLMENVKNKVSKCAIALVLDGFPLCACQLPLPAAWPPRFARWRQLCAGDGFDFRRYGSTRVHGN